MRIFARFLVVLCLSTLLVPGVTSLHAQTIGAQSQATPAPVVSAHKMQSALR